MARPAQVPPAEVPFLSRDGSVAMSWRNLFLALVERTGGYLGNVLAALAGLSTTKGILAQTGDATFEKRTITGTANNITVTNGAGTAGNPTIDLANVAGVAGVHAAPTSITVDAKGRITAIS